MPELPEVETVVRQLRPLIHGRTLTDLRIYDAKLGSESTRPLRGSRIDDIQRLGKQIVFQLQGPSAKKRVQWLAVHLRMTGRLVWAPSIQDEKLPHLRARFFLDQGSLQFFDTRRFGTLVWTTDAEQLQPSGIDPLADACTLPVFTSLVTQGKQSIKSWLMRQDRVVGIGNIYACEALYRARINPHQRTHRLSRAQIERLYRELRLVLEEAIANCGTTFSDFQNAHGVTGGYQNYLQVYGRENLPCSRCQRKIKRTLTQGRSTFYCAGCQR